MKLSIRIPGWLADRVVPADLIDLADKHGSARRSKTWLSGVIEATIIAKSETRATREAKDG